MKRLIYSSAFYIMPNLSFATCVTCMSSETAWITTWKDLIIIHHHHWMEPFVSSSSSSLCCTRLLDWTTSSSMGQHELVQIRNRPSSDGEIAGLTTGGKMAMNVIQAHDKLGHLDWCFLAIWPRESFCTKMVPWWLCWSSQPSNGSKPSLI